MELKVTTCNKIVMTFLLCLPLAMYNTCINNYFPVNVAFFSFCVKYNTVLSAWDHIDRK